MVEIEATYEDGLRCRAVHLPSGSTLETDAPRDNHGRGEKFSPTDLVAAALITCMGTTMGIRARPGGWSLRGMHFHVSKVMTSEPPRRIARLPVTVTIPQSVASTLDAAARALLEDAAHTCPVRLSLLDAIDVPVEFRWG